MPLEKSSVYVKKIDEANKHPEKITDKAGVDKYIDDVADFLHAYIENTGSDNGSKETKDFEAKLKNGKLLPATRDLLPQITTAGTFTAKNFEADAKKEADKAHTDALNETIKATGGLTSEEQSEAFVTAAMDYFKEAFWRFAAFKSDLDKIPQAGLQTVVDLLDLGKALYNAANLLDLAAAAETGRNKGKENDEIKRAKLVAKKLFEMAKEIFTLIKNKYGPAAMNINGENADKTCDKYIDAATKGIAKN